MKKSFVGFAVIVAFSVIFFADFSLADGDDDGKDTFVCCWYEK